MCVTCIWVALYSCMETNSWLKFHTTRFALRLRGLHMQSTRTHKSHSQAHTYKDITHCTQMNVTTKGIATFTVKAQSIKG